MSDFRHIQAGDKLPTAANTWNGMLDAARAHRYGGGGRPTQSAPASPEVSIIVKNTSEQDVRTGDALVVTEPLILPSSNKAGFRRAAMKAAVYDAVEPHHQVAIAQRPIPAGKMGKAVLSGVTAANVSGTVAAGDTVGPLDGLVTLGTDTEHAVATVIWAEEEDSEAPGNDRPALVMLGVAGAELPTTWGYKRFAPTAEPTVWSPPPGAKIMTILVVGAGGGGAGGQAGRMFSNIYRAYDGGLAMAMANVIGGAGGGGGGAGSVEIWRDLPVLDGEELTITVGEAGAGGTGGTGSSGAMGTNGGLGGYSSVAFAQLSATALTAAGGRGGGRPVFSPTATDRMAGGYDNNADKTWQARVTDPRFITEAYAGSNGQPGTRGESRVFMSSGGVAAPGGLGGAGGVPALFSGLPVGGGSDNIAGIGGHGGDGGEGNASFDSGTKTWSSTSSPGGDAVGGTPGRRTARDGVVTVFWWPPVPEPV